MNLQEKELWKSLAPMIPGHAQRIENVTGSGMPDLNVCWKGNEYWIELKVCEPKILIRREQWAWHNRRMASGGKCYLLAWHPATDMIYFQNTSRVNVMPYGKNGKYVEVVNKLMFYIIPKTGLRDFLKTNLFTS